MFITPPFFGVAPAGLEFVPPPLFELHAAATMPTTADRTTNFFTCFMNPPSGLGRHRNVFFHGLVLLRCPFLPLPPPLFVLVLIRVPGRLRIEGIPQSVA